MQRNIIIITFHNIHKKKLCQMLWGKILVGRQLEEYIQLFHLLEKNIFFVFYCLILKALSISKILKTVNVASYGAFCQAAEALNNLK